MSFDFGAKIYDNDFDDYCFIDRKVKDYIIFYLYLCLKTFLGESDLKSKIALFICEIIDLYTFIVSKLFCLAFIHVHILDN